MLRSGSGSRINSAKLSSTRKATSANSTSSISSKKEIKPSDIHQLRIDTTKLEQENKILRTQLSRTNDKIHSKVQSINKTVATSGTANPKNSYDSQIKQIQRSITSANNTLNGLENELNKIDYDDRNALIEELQEELKISYCEYLRVKDDMGSKGSDQKAVDRAFQAADRKASHSHRYQLETSLGELKDQNAALKEKILAYLTKYQKLRVEKIIEERQKEKMSVEYSLIEVEESNQRREEKCNRLKEEMNNELEDYQNKVTELEGIIMDLRRKIYTHLKGEPPESHETTNEEEEDGIPDEINDEDENIDDRSSPVKERKIESNNDEPEKIESENEEKKPDSNEHSEQTPEPTEEQVEEPVEEPVEENIINNEKSEEFMKEPSEESIEVNVAKDEDSVEDETIDDDVDLTEN